MDLWWLLLLMVVMMVVMIVEVDVIKVVVVVLRRWWFVGSEIEVDDNVSIMSWQKRRMLAGNQLAMAAHQIEMNDITPSMVHCCSSR